MIVTSIILALLVLLGLTAPGHPEIVDRVVAVVNGEVITFGMLEDAMNAVWVDPQKLPESQHEALQKLIDRKLELQAARRLGSGVIVSEENLSRELAKAASRFGSLEKLSEALQKRDMTLKDLQEILIEDIMIQEMINRRFRLFVEVTPAEALDYFEQNREKFMLPPAVYLDQILFQLAPGADKSTKENVRRRAEEVLVELRDGASFSKYANNAGSTAYIPEDQLIPVVAAAVSQLDVGQISDLIETPVGYFIIRLNDRRTARQATFDEVKEEIKAFLIQQKTEEEFAAWLKNQRDMADIRTMVDFKVQEFKSSRVQGSKEDQ